MSLNTPGCSEKVSPVVDDTRYDNGLKKVKTTDIMLGKFNLRTDMPKKKMEDKQKERPDESPVRMFVESADKTEQPPATTVDTDSNQMETGRGMI